jgi:serine/threonine-protein kinase
MVLTYQYLWRYPEVIKMLNRAQGVIPGDPSVSMTLAQTAVDERADLGPLQEILQRPIAMDASSTRAVEDPNYLLCLRTQAAADRALANFRAEGVPNVGVIVPHAYWEGVVARWENDSPRARAAFLAARALVAPVVASQPQLASAVGLLGAIDAGLGQKDQAVAEGLRACALLPTSLDASDGPLIAAKLAQIYAWTGNKQAAIDEIAEIEKKPNLLTYGVLKLNPIWDDLRGEPRFEALVETLAPKG